MSIAEWHGALQEIAAKCWQTSEEHGWHEEDVLAKQVASAIDFLNTADLLGGGDAFSDKILALLHAVKKRFFGHGGVQVMEKLMLIVTEVAEAAEDYRVAGIPLTEFYWLDESGQRQRMTLEHARAGRKPLGFPSEAADIVIRVFDLSIDLKIDIGYAIACKMAFNETRPYKHGGKVC